MVEEKGKEEKEDDEKSVTPERLGKDDSDPKKSKGKGSVKSSNIPLEPAKAQRKSSADRRARGQQRSFTMTTPPPGAITPMSDADNLRYKDIICFV